MQALTQLLNKKYKKELPYINAMHILESSWPDMVGELAELLFLDSIYYNKLIVKCVNPAWLSEVDYFKKQILDKCNQQLKAKQSKITITDVTVKLTTEQTSPVRVIKKLPPKTIEERIKWNIDQKKENGAVLCTKCRKVWEKQSICRLCQLT